MVRCSIRVISAIAGLSGLTALSLMGATHADSANFSQQILPLNCVFTTINAGTGELNYVTPAACGIYIKPPTAQSSSGSNISTESSTATANIGSSDSNPQLYQSAPNGPSGSPSYGVAADKLPWRPLATVSSVNPAVARRDTLVSLQTAAFIAGGLLLIVIAGIVLI